MPDFSALSFTVNNSRFLIGDFINALLSFIVLAAVVYYFVAVPIGRLVDRMTPSAPTRECPECLSKIPVKARRCAFCTTVLVDEVDAPVSRITGIRGQEA